MNIYKFLIVFVLVVLPFSIISFAQDMEEGMEKTDSSIMFDKSIVVKATVEALNVNERKVVLRVETGNVEVVEAGPEVKNFDQIDIGDKVTAEFYRSVAIHLGPPDELPKERETKLHITAPKGEKPGLLAVDVVDVIATVGKIDKKNRMVTLIGPEGNSITAKVDPRVGDLEKIKEGDKLHVRYTEAVAISVTEQ